MKTVQEHLKELDTEELINSYLALEPVHREIIEAMAAKDNITAKDLWLKFRNSIRNYIEHMREVPITPPEEASVLYVFEGVSTGFMKKRFHGLVHISELKESGVEAEDYSYILCHHGEVAGFFVADTKRTQENIVDLMTDVLYEASFFGYTEEDLAQYIKEIENESEDFGDDDEEETKEEAAGDETEGNPVLKKPEREIRSKKEIELDANFRNASEAYAKFLREKALREVAVSLFGKSQQVQNEI